MPKPDNSYSEFADFIMKPRCAFCGAEATCSVPASLVQNPVEGAWRHYWLCDDCCNEIRVETCSDAPTPELFAHELKPGDRFIFAEFSAQDAAETITEATPKAVFKLTSTGLILTATAMCRDGSELVVPRMCRVIRVL